MALNSSQLKVVSDNLQVLSSAGVPFQVTKLLMAQAMHETARFTSNVFFKNNNAFGMKMPGRRKSPFIAGAGTKPPSNEGDTRYAFYYTVKDSFLDRLHLAKYNGWNWNDVDTVQKFVAKIAKQSYFGSNPTATAINIYTAGMNNNLALLKDFIEPVLLDSKKKVNPLVVMLILVLAAVGLYQLKKKRG